MTIYLIIRIRFINYDILLLKVTNPLLAIPHGNVSKYMMLNMRKYADISFLRSICFFFYLFPSN